MSTSMQPIIIKKKKGHGHGHHGGSWKVAFADFMTAMMAFFLLMWLMAAANDPQKKAIAGYFNDVGGGLVGPGGANSGVIQFDNPESSPQEMTPPSMKKENEGGENERNPGAGIDQNSMIPLTEQQMREQYEKQEKENLQKLKEQLQEELNNSESVLREVRDQIIIDYTGLGLRVQIVDKEQRPMFDTGKAKMKDYSLAVLEALAPLLDSVPNHLSITGHTDAAKYGDGALYSNWELSADRANTARRALVDGGYPEEKIINVQGMGSAAPFSADEPLAPINRRIAILVLKKSVEEALLGKTGVSSEHVIESSGNVLMNETGAPAEAEPAQSAPVQTAPSQSAPAQPAAPSPTTKP